MSLSVVHQGTLLNHLKSIFPDGETHINARKHLALKYDSSDGYMEFDFCIPSLKLCFEFQDAYHYITTWYNHRSSDVIHQKDSSKQHIACTQELTLIGIPCWWDGGKESLLAEIKFLRPELGLDPPAKALQIPINPPLGFLQTREVPDVGELMLASFPLDPEFKYSIPCDSWWLGEKYDGMRCCWNGKQNKVYARTGKLLELLPSMVSAFSTQFLDSELWFGRGDFSATYSLFAGSYHFVTWDSLRIISFDVASTGLKTEPFEKRYKCLLASVSPSKPFHIPAPRILCKDQVHLSSMVREIIENGGEGVILRLKHSLYENGRSSSLIKLKTSQGDKEGIVMDVDEVGSILLKIGSGEKFLVPAEDVLISTPQVGEIVTFSFESHARRELPVRPKIYRIRTDVSWEDIVQNSAQERKALNDSSHIAFTAKPIGHWTMKNMRMMLEDFARKNKKDPLLPSTWYTTTRSALKKFKDGRAVLDKFKGGYFQAIKSLFPEIGLDAITYYRYLWRDPNSRRKFFENYAIEHGFDSSNPDNWYKQSRESIMAAKGASSVMSFHNKSVARALLDLYPNIGLDRLKCRTHYTTINEQKRKRFFETYAIKYEFDALVPENWYLQPKERIMTEKGAKAVMVRYSGDVAAALLEIFPDIGLLRHKFKVSWRIAENRRKFFEDYAKNNQFDPRNPSNWYQIPREAILEVKGASGVLDYYDGSLSKALMELFPDIGLDALSFSKATRDVGARKKFFENYAKTNGFNYMLPNNWYTQTSSQVLAFKGAYGVLGHHNNSFSQALIDLFPDIDFDKSQFREKFGQFSLEARRQHFENYAKENEFDPYNPANWYLQNKNHLVKRSLRVLNHYDHNPVSALLDSFPDIGLEKSQFKWK